MEDFTMISNFVDKIYSNYNLEAIIITSDFNYTSIYWNFDNHSNVNDASTSYSNL